MAGLIGGSLEAKVTVAARHDTAFSLLAAYERDLPSLFIVSEVELRKIDAFDEACQPVAEGQDIGIAISKAAGAKCQRCWNYSTTVGKNTKHPALCKRCVAVVTKA